MTVGLVQRGGAWHLKRRVPLRYASVEPRAAVWKSLKTDSRTVAVLKAEKVWLELIEGWEAKLTGKSAEASERFRAAQALSDIRGFRFLSVNQVAELPLEEILTRVEAVRGRDGQPDEIEAAALLGVVEEPRVMLSDFVAHVEALAVADNKYKNARQMRIWRNSRLRAASNLMKAIGGDIAIADLTSAHAKKHKKYWLAKIAREGTSVDTANKDFNYMAGMLARFYEDLECDDPPRPYAGVAIREKFKKPVRKDEVPIECIVDKWFAPGAFDGLNANARDILLISLETGCRQSEIFDLPSSAFRLEGAFPYLLIENTEHSEEGQGREIKNMHSARQVPLVGVALAAARRNPNGFPRYRGKAGYSATINKYLRTNVLVPDGVTAGGLRHTWESRMKKAGYQVDDRGELMGHSVKVRRGRETYGDALTLAERFEIVRSVAFPVPEHLA